ncbi:unnamed protein product [Urochloa decumbens]|uniref:KIB1-4 beta-propeller domain-containing protein n=1 Tax=Urochloa decumbens TaxID=240449 RepID=A0ABC9DSB7_9POAL
MGRMAGGGWSSLSVDLLELISGWAASGADRLHIHQVCTHWRASTSPPRRLPWVVAGHPGSGLYPIRDYSLRLPVGSAPRADVGALPAGLPYCCGTSQGGIALVDHYRYPTRLVLWEPLSQYRDPLAVSGIHHPNRPLRGADEINTVVFHEGKAYYIDIMGTIAIRDLSSGAGPESIQFFYGFNVLPRLCGCDPHHQQRGVHLVTCNGELLVVVLYQGSHPSPAEVYKPVWAPNQRLELHERVMNLGDHSLFVGRGDAFALSAKEFPAIKRNCIYYADKLRHKGYWISVFHLDSDVVEEIPYPEELKEDTTDWMPHAWFCPRTPLLRQQ